MTKSSEKSHKEPCAIVGAACRVPGATNTDALWKILEDRRDLQRKMPAERYNADSFYHTKGSNKGTSNARLGYYLDQGLDQFDASFFNISGKEAEAMDPQQRLLLEVVYEALENAGITLDDVRGSRTAVFAGSFTYDYQSMTHRELNHYPKYSITGSSTNTILANRISFFFGLHGPSVQIDTACSSSLTGFHLGAQSLLSGESDMAIICGTALHFDPTIFITMTDFGMLSTDGRCRHFDAKASGYVRGDGVCAIVLKKQHLAELHGNNIRAIVRGTGANHDGTKEGLTLPNPKAQADLVRDVYTAAGLEPKDTGYFEAHGTGTQAGDPREALGIGSVFAADRTEPLYVGSIKTNIGHLEGASGLAGVMKSMLSVEKGKIFPNMHFNIPNPAIDFKKLKIRVPEEVIDWNPISGVRRASINSFGFGGSNAHVVIENYQKTLDQFTPPDSPVLLPLHSRPFLLPLTSHTENGGKLLQKAITKYISENGHVDARDLAHSYSTRRTMHQFRTYAIGSNLEELSDKASNLGPEAKWKRATTSPRVGFIFTGQGAQWHAMGRQLIEENALFRHVLYECEATLQGLPDAPAWSLVDEMRKPESESRITQSEFSQPLCTALQIALVDVLKTWAIEPYAVVGHSSGEIAAAYAAGILSRSDAIICAFYRGLYMSKGKDGTAGSMMAVGLTTAEAALELEPYTGRACIAAVNSPSSITLSGDRDVMLEIKKTLDAKKVFARLLQVEQAFHSHHMFPLAPPFQKALASTGTFAPKPAKIRMFSSVTARDSSARPMDSTYWSDNMTGRVRFSDALTGMVLDDNDELAVDVLVEVGPHPALKGPSKQTIKALGFDVPYVASLDRKVKAFDSLLSCAGQLFALGHKVDLEAVNSDYTLSPTGALVRAVSGKSLNNLPTYSWDHKSYWSETRYSKEFRQRAQRHSLLGARVPGSPSTSPRWHNYLRNSELTWIPAHSIDNVVILPGAAYFTIAIEALLQTVPAQQIGDIVLSNVSIKAALTVPDTESGVEIMSDLSLIEEKSDAHAKSYRFAIYSFTEDGETVQNCAGIISATAIRAEPQSECTLDEFRLRTVHRQPSRQFYNHLREIGLQYGDPFRLVSGAFESASGFAVAGLVYDATKTLTDGADACVLHPTLVDSAFHVIFAALESKLGYALDDAYVPTFCGTLRIAASLIGRKYDAAIQKYWVTAQIGAVSPRLASGEVIIHEPESKSRVVELQGLKFTALGLSSGKEQSRPVYFRIKWQPAFDCLGLNVNEPELSTTEDLIACYSHQFPENKVLRISSRAEIEESGQFDLIVAEAESEHELSSILAPNGFLVGTKTLKPPVGLDQKIALGELVIWQAPAQRTWPKHLTVLLASSPSEQTLNIVRNIEKESSSDTITITTLTELSEKGLPRDDYISLVGLDEDIFTHASSQFTREFENLRKILSTPGKRVLWLYGTTDHGAESVCGSLILGLARVARLENDSLRMVTLELQGEYAPNQICGWICHSFTSINQDDEFVVKGGQVTIPRVETDDKLNQQIARRVDVPTDLFQRFEQNRLRLMESPFGADPDLVAFEMEHTVTSVALGDDDVEIAVEASPLARNDTIASCAGKVVRAGRDVGLNQGDMVFALCPDTISHASIVRTKAHLVHQITDASLSAFIGVPVIEATYALHELARVQKNDICIVHDALSIKGQIAISLLKLAGAEIIATVSKDSDQAVLSSRFNLKPGSVVSLDDEHLVALTKKAIGKQARLLLDCGSDGSELRLSDCVGVTGVYIQIGRDEPNIDHSTRGTTHAVADLATVVQKDERLAQRLLQEGFEKLKEIVVPPLEDREKFAYSEVSEAFHSFKADSSLSRVLLYANDSPVPIRRNAGGLPVLFNANKTYLIVGGLGGIGQVLAQWMYRKGARKFSFLARSGATKADAKETVQWLQQRGSKVTVYSGSVTDEQAVRKWVEGIKGELGGIFQCATVLRSGSLEKTTAQRWQTVLDPKVRGTLNLHYATVGRDLDFFLCFSSLLAIIGFPSEANYSAANVFMDHFIAWRRQQGLPGTAINIGVVADAGLIAESESLKTGMQRMHMDMLSDEELFFQIEQGILSQYSAENSNGVADHQLLSGINVASRDPHWSSKALFSGLYANVNSDGAGVGSADKNLLSQLVATPSVEEMKDILGASFVEKISSSLSIPTSDIHLGLPLSSYGMDSLVAVDFRKWFSKEVGVDLALFDILGSKTTGHLVLKVCEMFKERQSSKTDSSDSTNEVVEKQSSTEHATELIIPKTKSQNLPLSSFQTRLWFMDNMIEKSGGLSIGVTLRIKGEPQLEDINRSFHELARRNETLRTRYFEGDDFAQQEILPAVPTHVQYLDISTAPAPLDRVQSQIEELIGEPMDLERGEVYRSRLVKLAESEYAWLFSIHHIAVDGGSRQSFMEQIVSCYNDVRAEQHLSASGPRLSYVDFTLWHEEVLQSAKVQSDLAWWKEYMDGAQPASKLLPFAQHTRPESASDNRRTIRSKIDKATLKRMKRICSSVNVTPFHFILAALRAFIFRYTAEEDVTILVINGERPHSSFEGILGLFVNIIPLRWQGAFEETFENLLAEAKDLAMESMEHSQAPFNSIVDSLNLEWNPQTFPLGQIALNYHIYAKSPKYTTTDFEITDVHITDVPTACELQFEVLEDPETGLGFALDYDSYLYGAPEMDRFLENFMTFVGSAVQDFRQPIEEVDMCGKQELEFLRSNCWLEQTSKLQWMDMPLWERFVEVARQQPKSIAVQTSEGHSITYEKLLLRAKETASLLQANGISPGDRVGVLSHPCIDAIAAMLSMAILRCTYIPLDPNYAPERLKYMIEDTSPSLILYGSGLQAPVESMMKTAGPKLLSLNAPLPVEPLKIFHESGRPGDLFYIVYTSGSTGKPKGIMVSHENTRAMLAGRNEALNLSKNDVFLSHSSISFDISITQTWGSFVSGATVSLATNDTKRDIGQLAAFIRDSGVSMIFMTPTQFAMMLENCIEVLQESQSLRKVSMIGEHLHPRLASAIYDLGIPKLIVFNEYGPSETTSQNTLYKVPHPAPGQRTIDVGHPLPNNSVYIVNSKLRPVPVGVTGEVCLGGPQISLGYLGNMQSVFMANPFVAGIFKARGWDRLYRTGDLAKFRTNGLIDLEGRMSGDKQIKLRGNRINLEEIESEIHRVSSNNTSLPLKRGVVVIARILDQAISDSLTDDRQLVAFLVTDGKIARAEQQKIANILQTELQQTLNGYMLPAYYQMMEALPSTLSGKVNRVELNKMKLDPVFPMESATAQALDEPKEIHAADQHTLIASIKKIFTTILKLPGNKHLQDTDNFFSLGGHSVLALRLQKALNKEFETRMALIDIFRNPTPSGLAALLMPQVNVAPTPSELASNKVSTGLDWDKEIHLPDEKKYRPATTREGSEVNPTAKGTLLVGADGFVGYYMLKYLLMLHPDTKVYLLSLGERFNLGDLFSSFMQHNLFGNGLTQSDLLTRTEIIQGTMGEDKYGLSDNAFVKLGQSVQSIYHTGGFVSLLATYSDLRTRNVQSIFTMIELASHGISTVPTALHYISTWSVIHLQTWKTTALTKSSVWLDEQNAESFRPPPVDDHGYFKTRWVAEMLLEEAARRGFPTTLYRCPAHTAPIGSPSATPSDNFTINMYMSMAERGHILHMPEREDGIENDVGMVPIDYLADTIIRLADTKESRSASGEALRLHVSNPDPLPYSKAPAVIAEVREDNVPGKLLDVDAWFEAVTATSSEKEYLGWAMFKEYLDNGHLMFTINDPKTRVLLREIDAAGDSRRVKCHPVNADYFRSILTQKQMFAK